MNVSQFLSEVADVLDDPNGEMYPQAEVVRNGDRQLRGLYRTLSEGSQQYANFTMALQKEAAAQPMQYVYEYRLPLWVMVVRRVWIRTSTSPLESTYSVYNWTPGTVTLGELVPKSNATQAYRRCWSWEGRNTLRLLGFTEPQELIVEVLTLPNRMFKGKIQTETVDPTKIYLPSPNYGQLETETGAYTNSDWQVSETANVNAVQYGEIRRCIYSTSALISAGSRYTELTMDAPFAAILAQGDTIETVLPLPDEHTRVLVLASARACFQKKGNQKGLEMTMSEYIQESQRFVTYATTPRDNNGPISWKFNNRARNRIGGYGMYPGGPTYYV